MNSDDSKRILWVANGGGNAAVAEVAEGDGVVNEWSVENERLWMR